MIDRIIEQINGDKKVSGKLLSKISKELNVEPLRCLTDAYIQAKGIEIPPTCHKCNAPVLLISTFKGFRKFCSKSCASSYLNAIHNADKNKRKGLIKFSKIENKLKEALTVYLDPKNFLSLREVADQVGVPHSSLRKYATKSGKIRIDIKSKRMKSEFKEQTDPRLFDVDYLTNCSKKKMTLREVADEIGVAVNTVRLYALEFGVVFDGDSAGERQIKDFIKEFDPDVKKTRQLISPLELDVYSQKFNLAVEYNGSYWHQENRVGKDYHLNKQVAAEKKGISLLQIFDYEWDQKRPIVESMIKSKINVNARINARDCYFVVLDKKTGSRFFDDNHLHGSVGCSHVFGLEHDGQIVAAMSFGRSRFQKDQFELLRFCNKIGVNVIGGFSKLFRNAEKRIQFNEIITYSHRRLFSGKAYHSVGFELIRETSPGYFWVNPRDGRKLSRYQTQKHKLNTEQSETDYMTSQGFVKVFDCGQLVFLYRRKTHGNE